MNLKAKCISDDEFKYDELIKFDKMDKIKLIF